MSSQTNRVQRIGDIKKLVQEFINYFRIIEFAVYCSPRDEQNYTVFKKILGEGQSVI